MKTIHSAYECYNDIVLFLLFSFSPHGIDKRNLIFRISFRNLACKLFLLFLFLYSIAFIVFFRHPSLNWISLRAINSRYNFPFFFAMVPYFFHPLVNNTHSIFLRRCELPCHWKETEAMAWLLMFMTLNTYWIISYYCNVTTHTVSLCLFCLEHEQQPM